MKPAPNQIIHVPRRFVAHEWGGTETVILECAKQQQAMGFHPSLLTSMALADTPQEELSGLPIRRFPHHYPFLGLASNDRQAMDKKGGNLLSWPLFRALLKEPNTRLFHAHALKRLGGMVRTAARLRKLPYVVSLHGGVFDVPQDELADLTRPIQGKFEWGKPLGAVLGARRVLEDADHVICVGQSEAEQARRTLSHDRISYLPNGVDPQRFAHGDGSAFRAKHGISKDAFLILCVSRLDAQKNQLGLLEGFQQLLTDRPQAHLLLIGPETQPAYAEQLRRFIRHHGLDARVTLIPGLSNDSNDLTNAYHAADVFTLASRHEPFGIVVLEAWSAGCPVVTARVGGLRHLVTEDVNGLTFDPQTADAPQVWAHHLCRLSEDAELRARLGAQGQAEARSHYDWAKIAQRLEAIYQRAETHSQKRHLHLKCA